MIDDPKEEVAQESGQLIVEFQPRRPFHEPRYGSLQCRNRIHAKYLTDILCYRGAVVDNIGAEGDADNDLDRQQVSICIIRRDLKGSGTSFAINQRL
jgi:hypothetical protein